MEGEEETLEELGRRLGEEEKEAGGRMKGGRSKRGRSLGKKRREKTGGGDKEERAKIGEGG